MEVVPPAKGARLATTKCRALSVAAPLLWDSLSLEARLALSRLPFRKLVKTKLCSVLLMGLFSFSWVLAGWWVLLCKILYCTLSCLVIVFIKFYCLHLLYADLGCFLS